MASLPTHVSAKRAAELVGLSARTIRRWVAAGRLPAVKRGRSFRIAVADLAAVSGEPLAPSADPAPAPAAGPPPALAAGDGGPLAALVRELTAELVQATATAARWRTVSEVLAAQLELAEQQLRQPPGGPGRAFPAPVDRPAPSAWLERVSAADEAPLGAPFQPRPVPPR